MRACGPIWRWCLACRATCPRPKRLRRPTCRPRRPPPTSRSEAAVVAERKRECAGGDGQNCRSRPLGAPTERADEPATELRHRCNRQRAYAAPRPTRNFLMIGDRNEPFGFLVSARPVSRCAICRNILVVR